MIVKIQRGRRKKTEHGYQTFEELQEVSPCTHCFEKQVEPKCCGEDKCTPPKVKHIITIPFKKHIHPCYKDKLQCYEGDYYDTDKKQYLNPCNSC